MELDGLERLRQRSITKLDDAAALEHIGDLIDASDDAYFERGADRALHLLEQLSIRELEETHGAIAEYFRANAWGVKEKTASARSSMTWEHPAREEQILALSRAVAHPGFSKLHKIRRCQVLTNRANQLVAMGRLIDAVEGWRAALRIIPNFAIAHANLARCLRRYGALLENDEERAILWMHAHDSMAVVTSAKAVFDGPYPEATLQAFATEAKRYADGLDIERVRAFLEGNRPSLGRTKAERLYRQWSLDKGLFLHPLNDLGAYPIAAFDDLHLPSISEQFDERPGAVSPPAVIGFFNQIKQEYVSARYMLYEGLSSTKFHFSDRGVRLSDTLDYPLHSLAMERVRTAYRIAYSLLDKVAFLVDFYWKLKKNPDHINFKNVWMVEGKKQLLDRFRDSENWPLRGLFWLSKELFDEKLNSTTSPDARELYGTRNALEHKCLQVHFGWVQSYKLSAPGSQDSRLSITSDFLEEKALRVMKMARSALVQLALAIGVEERTREESRPSGTVILSMPNYALDDKFKRRDPVY